MKKLFLLAASFLALTTGARAQAPSLEARVSLSSADRTLEDIVAFLRERSGANIVVIDPENDPKKISSEKIVIELNDVPWRDALDLVAEKVHGVVEERTAGVLAVTRPPAVDFSFPSADIREVIDTIAKSSGANVVIGPEVIGTVTVRLKGVPWRDALDVVAKSQGFVVVNEGHGLLRVVSPEKLQKQLITKTYQLRYIRPKSVYKPVIKSDFVQSPQQTQQAQQQQTTEMIAKSTFTVLQALQTAISPDVGKIDYIDSQNALVVRDTAQVHNEIKEILNRLDVEPVQVFCDVKFVTTSNGDVLNLGVDYGDNGPQVTLTGGQIPVTFPFVEGKGGWDDAIIASPSGHGPFADAVTPNLNGGATVIPDTIFGALSFTQVQATLRLLQRDTKSEVIQAPKIFAVDGSEATIFVGETIRYAEARAEQGQAGGLSLSVQEASGSPVEVGFQLLIRPNVIPGTQRIVMEVIPKETSLSGTGTSTLAPPGFDVFTIGASGLEGSIALPRTRSSTIVSTMMIDSGKTAVIGGLTTDSDIETETRVPGLSAIPILGELFKHRAHNRDRRSLLVFLTPSVVHNSQDTEFLLQQELNRRRTKLKDEVEKLVSPTVADNAKTEAPK